MSMQARGFEPESLKRQLRPIFEKADIRMVALFGSHAAGRGRPGSDLDLALLGDDRLDLLDLTNQIMQILAFSQVDLVDLRRCSPTLGLIVAQRGRLLYERDAGTYASFCSLALRRYEDARKLREAQKQSILTFLGQRGLHVSP